MSCGCGCGPRRRCAGIGDIPVAQLAAGNFTGALASASPQAATIAFDASQIYGQAANDVATAQNVVDTFTSSGVDLTGDQGKKQVQQVALALQLIPGVGTVLGGAILAITSAGGFAHAGAGVCSTAPPSGPGWGDLKTWPYYTDWARSGDDSAPAGQGWYEGKDPAGSFEAFANMAIAYNEALANNCYTSLAVKPQDLPALLAQLIQTWNASHLGPTKVVSRAMPGGNIGDTAPGYDPIAFALEWTDPSGALQGKKLTFSVNTGPAIPKKKVVSLHLASAASNALDTAAAAKATAAASSASSSGTTAAVVAVGGAAAAAAVFVHVRGVSALPAWLRTLFR
jgi:hypothetical protein